MEPTAYDAKISEGFGDAMFNQGNKMYEHEGGAAQQEMRAALDDPKMEGNPMIGTPEYILQRNQLKKEKLKLKRKAKRLAQRALHQAPLGGDASVNGGEHAEQGPAAKRRKHKPKNQKEGKPLPQGEPITYHVLIETVDGSPLEEVGRTTFLGRYTRELANQPRDSPHRGFISAGVYLHEDKIKIFCFTLEGATSVKTVAESAVDESGYHAYKGTIYKDERLTRIIVGIPGYMAGPEMGDGDLVVKALESLNHGVDPLPVDTMTFIHKRVNSNNGQVHVFLDINDATVDWLKRHTWSFRTVSSMATAHIVKTSVAPQPHMM